MVPILLLLTLAIQNADEPQVARIDISQTASSPYLADPRLTVAGREADARVARVAYRLAAVGRARCASVSPSPGFVLQHLSQFALADRAGVLAASPLDRGPEVIVVVPGGPAAVAGVHAGDIILTIDNVRMPEEKGLDRPFDAAQARSRVDAVDDLLDGAGGAPLMLTLLRGDALVSVRVVPAEICPSDIHLARSPQRNAYADGRHVLVTTGLLQQLHGDDELAFVLAHEMAHNILGHPAIMRSGQVNHGIGRALGASGRAVRGMERAADALAGDLMIDAGYNPVAGAGMLKRFGDVHIGLLAEHDGAARRVALMRALVQARRVP